MLIVTDREAEKYTAAFTATPGTKLYIDSIAEENRLRWQGDAPHAENEQQIASYNIQPDRSGRVG